VAAAPTPTCVERQFEPRGMRKAMLITSGVLLCSLGDLPH
jgi:hypothetical protein